jgi:cytochrome c oxidase subunit II
VTVASRLRTLAAAVTAVVAPLALAPAALADTATPENPVGPASHAIDNIYRAVIGTTMVIFILVGGWLVYSAIRFRARPGRPIEPPQVHGSSRLEWGWTIVPVLILIGLAGYTFHKLPDVKDSPADSMVVNVVAQQFQFSYVYGANSGAAEGKAPATAATLVVPEDTPVKLEVHSRDVVHDWWVPSLGPKVDAIPGQTTTTWFRANHVGTYTGQCAEFCGVGHSTMLITVKVVSAAEWQTFAGGLK